MLILTTAAFTKIRAGGLDPLRRPLDYPQQPPARKPLLGFRQFRFDDITGRRKGYEYNKIIQPRHAFATESDIADSQTNLFRYSGTHFTSLEVPELGRKKILGAASR